MGQRGNFLLYKKEFWDMFSSDKGAYNDQFLFIYKKTFIPKEKQKLQ